MNNYVCSKCGCKSTVGAFGKTCANCNAFNSFVKSETSEDKAFELNELANSLKQRENALEELNNNFKSICECSTMQPASKQSPLEKIAINSGLSYSTMVSSLIHGLELEISELKDKIAQA